MQRRPDCRQSPAGPAEGCVLVVDDDERLRGELLAGLQAYGFQTLGAAGSDAALAILSITPEVAVVLTDIRMPGCGGIALAEQILAAQLPARAVEVILLSGHAGLADAQRALRAAAFDLLVKPARLADIAAVVGRALARALERRRAAVAAEQQRLDREALHAAAPIGLGRLGPDARLTGANPALMAALGVAEGASLAELWARQPAAQALVAPTLERLLAGSPQTADRARSERVRLQLERPAVPVGTAPQVLDVHLYAVPDAAVPGQVAAVGLACLDVTAEAALVRELEHRVKNTFAVFLGLVHGAARSAASPDVAAFASELQARVRALATAHDLVRPAVTGASWLAPPEPTTLGALAAAVVAPYDPGGPAPRIRLNGPELAVGPGTAPALALVLNELATNALKHGALSAREGVVTLDWVVQGEAVEVTWRETGGPSLPGPPARPGFGMRLLKSSDIGRRHGGVTLDWTAPAGLRAHFTVPLPALAA